MLRSIIAPEGSSYCVRHADEEVSFAFSVVKSLPVPRVRYMPERQTNREMEALILMHVFRQCKTVRAHTAANVCVLYRASTLQACWETGWFLFPLSPIRPGSGRLLSSAADLITAVLDNISQPSSLRSPSPGYNWQCRSQH